MRKKILIAQSISRNGIDLLEEKGYEPVYAQSEDRDHIKEMIRGCHGAISKTFFLDREILSCAPNLKVIGKHGIGVDNVVSVTDATALGICVCNTPVANCHSVAEHTMGFLIALAKHFGRMDRAVRANDFGITDRLFAGELKGKTLGLVGLGNIGKIVARMAHMGFEMTVIAYDPYADGNPDYVSMTDDLDTLLAQSDFVSLHVPAIPQTNRMIGLAQIRKMKLGAYLVNCARGSVVDENALALALRENLIRGAALDVYESEPPAPDHPLLALPNVILTPHSAALSEEALFNMSYYAAMGVDEVLSGKKPTWCVNWDSIEHEQD